MNETNTLKTHVEVMQEAWYMACLNSFEEKAHLQRGYALFKPEYAEEIRKRHDFNVKQYQFWAGQA